MGDPCTDLDHSVVNRGNKRRHELTALVACTQLATLIGATGIESALIINYSSVLIPTADPVYMSIGDIWEGDSHRLPEVLAGVDAECSELSEAPSVHLPHISDSCGVSVACRNILNAMKSEGFYNIGLDRVGDAFIPDP